MDSSFDILILHKNPKLIDACCELTNSEWPCSLTARRRRLESSCDNLPTNLVLVNNENGNKPFVVGHSKITAIPSLPEAAFIESVVIDKNLRGKGLGRILMQKTEEHIMSLGLKEAYLSTHDQQGFYSKLGYLFCERVSIYGSTIVKNQWENEVNYDAKNLRDPIKATLPSGNSTLPPPPPPPPMPIVQIHVPKLVPQLNKSGVQQKKDFMKKVLCQQK